MHLHAFSPEEVLYGSLRSGLPIPDYLKTLRAAGLGTLPGTSAEILDQEIRDRIARGRITVDQWIEVITSAHALGIRTTSTIMYGHVETPAHWIRHMALLRDIQRQTGGFTEFVPLSLIHQEAPMYRRGLVPDVRQGATGIEVVKMHALARLMLGPSFTNIQASWVKEGPKMAQYLLASGANDLGGTLITLYELVKVYTSATDEDDSPLDHIADPEARFGSYRRLASSGEFRFLHPERSETPHR